ncbi:MAG: chorismate mutase [Alphaproteobacteria bacterium]|nr:chorismate mutase [Alphaproteobacteria bacterium]
MADGITGAVAAKNCHTMGDIRREIDRVDRQLVRLLAERLTYIERAGHIKQQRTAVRDEARISDVLSKVASSCASEGFPYSIAEPVWRALMEGCIAHEFDVFDARMLTSEPIATSSR